MTLDWIENAAKQQVADPHRDYRTTLAKAVLAFAPVVRAAMADAAPCVGVQDAVKELRKILDEPLPKPRWLSDDEEAQARPWPPTQCGSDPVAH